MSKNPRLCLAVTAAVVIAVTFPPPARATERPPLLVGLMLTTGQALAWDGEREEYVLLRPGSRYRGYTVRRLLIDRLIVTREGQLLELPLTPAPLIQRGSRRPERRGTPAGILITSTRAPVQSSEPPGPPPTVAAAPEARRTEAAPASQPTSQPAAAPRAEPAPQTLPATSPNATPPTRATRPVGPRISLSALRREVSRLVQGRAPYRFSLPRSGGVLLENIRANSLFGALGLRDGDLVISVGGAALRSREKAINYYLSLRPGHRLDVVVLRNGERRRLAVKVVS
jgi:hypothetical protein